MKITVVIPNQAWANTAGVRIRYNRISAPLEAAGHSFDLVPIDSLRAGSLPKSDMWIISKCHDARALLLAQVLKSRGVLVGVDFFDDYYSQKNNSRFVHLRSWFRSILPSLDFGLCSTPNMQATLKQLAPALPCHVMNDPFAQFDPDVIAGHVERNAARTLETKVVDIGWFGIGDNPHFTLGLHDLSAMGQILARCRQAGYAPRLSVLTNQRALTVERLELLSRLSVPMSLEEWSEERESALIAQSLFCFLPVNAQHFSVVKSLNRAVTTLSGGAQVLSAGFPLYAPLSDYVYRDPLALLRDLEEGKLKMRRKTLASLGKLMQSSADPSREVEKAVSFFKKLKPRKAAKWPARGVAGVIHGVRSSGDVHKGVQRLGHLSVSSPASKAKLNYDVDPRMSKDGQTLDIHLSARARNALPEDLKTRTQETAKQDPKAPPRFSLRLTRKEIPALPRLSAETLSGSRLQRLEFYDREMDMVQAVLCRLYTESTMFRSEMASPYWSDLGVTR